jgi:hypothetical protein
LILGFSDVGAVIMSNDSQQIMLPKWATDVLVIAAGICLIVSLYLAIADKVAAGTLTAGLFVVCVLFIYLPRMQTFKAWGIEVAWQAVRANDENVRRHQAEVQSLRDELKAQLAKNVPIEQMAVTVDRVDKAITQLSTANNALSVTIGAVGSTIRPDYGRPPFSATSRSE